MRLFSAATADRDSLGKTEISLWVYDGGFDCGFKSVSLVNLATEVYCRRFQRRFLIQVILESKWSFSVWIYGYRRFFKVMEWLSIRVDDRRLLIRLFIGSNGIPRGWIHGYRWILKATESLLMIFGDLCLGLMIVFRSMRIWNQEESEGCCVFRFGFKAKQWGLVPGRDLKAYGPILGFLIDVVLALGLCALVWLDMLVPGGGRYLFRLTLVFRLYWEFEFLEWSLNGIYFSDCDVLSDFEFVLVAVWFWAADQRFFRLKTIEKRRLDRGVFNRWLFNNRNGRALISFQRASVAGHNFSKRYDVGRLCLDFELSFKGFNKRFYYGLISGFLWLVMDTIRVKVSRFNFDWVSLKKNQRNEGYYPMHHGSVHGLTGGRNPPKPKFNK